MKIAIIDTGSNSVRLALTANGKTLYKRMVSTRLGEGLSFSNTLSKKAIERTARAIADFKAQAQTDGAEKIFAFATAAARSAQNASEFLECVKRLCGLEIDVISGQAEAQIGLLGAVGNADGGIIDLGGASCEVTVREGGKIIYSESVDAGAVRILDACGRDRLKIEKYIAEKLPLYGDFNAQKYAMYGISGTPTSLAAAKHKLKAYDPEIVHGTVLTAEDVKGFADAFLNMSVEQIISQGYIATWRADVIGGASLFLYELMRRMRIDKLTVSESDNLEGYLIYKGIL